jgi:hypothetical protein
MISFGNRIPFISSISSQTKQFISAQNIPFPHVRVLMRQNLGQQLGVLANFRFIQQRHAIQHKHQANDESCAGIVYGS